MIAGPARHEEEPSSSPDGWQIGFETTQHHSPRVEVHTASHRVYNRLRLLIDFFLHEMVILTFHDLGELNFEVLDRTYRREAIITSEAVDMQL